MTVFRISTFFHHLFLTQISHNSTKKENNTNNFIHSIINISQLHHHIAQIMFQELIQNSSKIFKHAKLIAKRNYIISVLG